MKKTIIICVIAIFAITACKKENTTNMNQEPQTDSQKTEALILAFKDKLDNHLKDGTVYAADSAVWYVEALLNYTYGYATALGCTFETDSAATTVNTNGGAGYSLTQLYDVYQYLEEKATGNIPEDHYIFCIDVSLQVTGNQSVFSGVTGYAKQLLPSLKSTADTSGYWFWGRELGMCGPDTGLYVGMDATDILEALVNSTAEYDYFTNIEVRYATYWSNYIDPKFPFNNPNLLPHRIFCYQDTTNLTDFCMSPQHIRYYSGNDGLIYILKDLKPENKDFAYCSIIYTIWGSQSMLTHNGYFYYGNPVDRP